MQIVFAGIIKTFLNKKDFFCSLFHIKLVFNFFSLHLFLLLLFCKVLLQIYFISLNYLTDVYKQTLLTHTHVALAIHMLTNVTDVLTCLHDTCLALQQYMLAFLGNNHNDKNNNNNSKLNMSNNKLKKKKQKQAT